MPPFTFLRLWDDAAPRRAAENMAADELLLGSLREGDAPVLRLYRWAEPAVTFGYFASLAEARRLFPDAGLVFVRRMTGGGVVDHRGDATYTLAVPRSHPLACERGAGSYRAVHAALAEAFVRSGTPSRLVARDSDAESAACFQKPVEWDLVGADGEKLAGAGQRRSRHGLLHQGSVRGIAFADLARHLPAALAERTESFAPPFGDAEIEALAARKYAPK